MPENVLDFYLELRVLPAYFTFHLLFMIGIEFFLISSVYDHFSWYCVDENVSGQMIQIKVGHKCLGSFQKAQFFLSVDAFILCLAKSHVISMLSLNCHCHILYSYLFNCGHTKNVWIRSG